MREVDAPVILNKRQHLLGLPGYWFIVPIELGFLGYGAFGGSLTNGLLTGAIAYTAFWILLHDKPPNFTTYWFQYLAYPKRFGHRARALPTPPFRDTENLVPSARWSWASRGRRQGSGAAYQASHSLPNRRPSPGNDRSADSLDNPARVAMH